MVVDSETDLVGGACFHAGGGGGPGSPGGRLASRGSGSGSKVTVRELQRKDEDFRVEAFDCF